MPKYKELEQFPGYRVGDDGTVWTKKVRVYRKGFGSGVSYKTGKTWIQMKPNVMPSGYRDVQLWVNGKSIHRLVHRLVLFAFVGNPPPGHESFHINNNPGDNRLENLRWATKKENQRHRKLFKTDSSGERHGLASMTNDTARAVRERFSEVGSKAIVAREFGLTYHVVSRCVRGLTYRG